MPVIIEPVERADAAGLIQSNLGSRPYHAPWARPFTDQQGFGDWLSTLADGVNVSLVAGETQSGGIVGVTTLSQIFRKSFQNAYLGYYGMVG